MSGEYEQRLKNRTILEGVCKLDYGADYELSHCPSLELVGPESSAAVVDANYCIVRSQVSPE